MVHSGTALMQARPTRDLCGRPAPGLFPVSRMPAPGSAAQAQRALHPAAPARPEKLAHELLNPE